MYTYLWVIQLWPPFLPLQFPQARLPFSKTLFFCFYLSPHRMSPSPIPPPLPPSPLPLSWRRKSYVEHLLTHPLSFQEQGSYEVGVCSSFLWVHLILSVGTRVGKLRCPVLLVSFPSTRFVLYIVQCMTVVHRSPFFYLSSFISACLLFILCKTGKDNLPHGSGWMKWVNVYRVSEMERGTWEFPHQWVFFVVVGT